MPLKGKGLLKSQLNRTQTLLTALALNGFLLNNIVSVMTQPKRTATNQCPKVGNETHQKGTVKGFGF